MKIIVPVTAALLERHHRDDIPATQQITWLANIRENLMLKFLGIVIAIIFIIGLLVVLGVFKLIF